MSESATPIDQEVRQERFTGRHQQYEDHVLRIKYLEARIAEKDARIQSEREGRLDAEAAYVRACSERTESDAARQEERERIRALVEAERLTAVTGNARDGITPDRAYNLAIDDVLAALSPNQGG